MTSSEPAIELETPLPGPPLALPSEPTPRMANRIATDLLHRLERLAAGHACELLEAEFRGGSLRLIVERPEGVTHEHCAGISREASVLLDAEDFGPASGYVLEVSSPGLDRKLYRGHDYERFRDQRAKITFTDGTGKRRTVRGVLQGLSEADPGIALLLEDDSGATLPLALDRIHKARLLVEL